MRRFFTYPFYPKIEIFYPRFLKCCKIKKQAVKKPATSGRMSVLLCLFFVLSTSFAQDNISLKHWQTSKGARVVFYEAHEVPMLDIIVAFKAGSAYDGEQHGLSALTASMLNQGNGGFDANAIAEKLADTGAQFSSDSNRDMVALSLRSLTEPPALEKALATFALIINQPDFPKQAFVIEKNQQLMAIRQAEESPDEIANQTFFKVLYGNHPYAHPVNGDAEHVSSLEVEDIRQFYRQYFTARNAVIVLAGAISEEKAHKIAEQLSKKLPQGEPAAPIKKPQPLDEEMNIEVPFPSSQTIIRLGQLGIDHHDPQYFPLLVGNYILGGGSLVSRLSEELREKRGLTYGVSSQFVPMPGDGPFVIGLSTRREQTAEAIEVTRDTLTSFVKTGPTQAELTAAKQYLTGSFPLSLASNRNIADMLLKIAFYQLPDDYLAQYTARIDTVTLEEIKNAFQQKLHPDKLLQVTVGKK
ncbi:zinc protease (peptidase, M16 family) [Legionella londiniensis]|uniref:Zinc protease (Peptidase, M16 family) n=2 Tax=Legionella londiniensis TaxID=45068 RepID=A0A0W0VHR5_9GAMM|nr:zinc protease (peptidase, M16 family) [Legionella londiniensis]STX92427.1 zinc protease (peptidase, M16 family) [Legionella londiniensis]